MSDENDKNPRRNKPAKGPVITAATAKKMGLDPKPYGKPYAKDRIKKDAEAKKTAG